MVDLESALDGERVSHQLRLPLSRSFTRSSLALPKVHCETVLFLLERILSNLCAAIHQTHDVFSCKHLTENKKQTY